MNLSSTWKHRGTSAALCFLSFLLILFLGLSACGPRSLGSSIENMITPLAPTPVPAPTSGRPEYGPGELVDYIAQNGDSLPALAARFNTTVEEILEANPIIPREATTMPPGMPMKIPIYYLPLWGTPYKSIPDHAFVNGPAQIGFSTSAFVSSVSGWLKNYRVYAGEKMRTGAEAVDYIATNYSISPQLLLAILEYQSGALTQPEPPAGKYMLGFRRVNYETPYLQLIIAANTLNNGYYAWRAGRLTEIELLDGSLFRPDPWQNAGSVALQYYFSRLYTGDKYYGSIGPEGLARVYQSFFGDPWAESVVILPGSLQQPPLRFPFVTGQLWAYTGGPHTGWGSGEPFAAIDFAPASEKSGCKPAEPDQYATAMADGLVLRSDIDGTVIDLDKDGDERTGWILYYLHLATQARVPLGKEVKAGEPIGYPSCEGGRVTGTHVHVARKYNGEWILADGPLAFNLEGWVAHNGPQAYKGTLTRGAAIVTACECSDFQTHVVSEVR
ncbi:MAG TPA: LysM peptidoglycan-binding domain-containing M23 family metallopeptidase [Anaerolineales bacterium]|nr:LysM peptidoglycan-binding domain-containing M23 family metallopeptidase [Anaerolineales bacterium]